MGRRGKMRLSLGSKLLAMMMMLGLYSEIGAVRHAQAQEVLRDSATIVMYHRFGESRYPSTNISLEQFDAHIAHLSSGKYNVVPLAEIIDTLRAGKLLPDRTVAITIDDAYQSVLEHAWPRLKAANFPFTLFVATSPIDRGLPSYMSWDDLRMLQQEGVTIGSQTHTHPHLHRNTPEQIKEELDISNSRFIEELGLRPEFFAYPYGEYSSFVVDIIKEAGFTTAFGQNSGIMYADSNFFELPRFAFNEDYGSVDRLKLAVDGLPLKVTDITPDDMVITQNPPIYGFTLHPEMEPSSQLRCFASSYGKLDVTILGRRVEVRVPDELPSPRSRINCTMPATENRWRWFGRQFLTE